MHLNRLGHRLLASVLLGATSLFVVTASAQELFTGFGATDLAPVVGAGRLQESREDTPLDSIDGTADFAAEPSLDESSRVEPASALALSTGAGLNVPTTPLSRDLTDEVWMVSFDYLTWKPRQRGMDFAVAEDGNALTVGTGRIHNLELDRDNGFRSEVGFQTKTGWSMSARFTYFDTDGTATVERPPGIGELFATRSHPDTNEEADIAVAVGSFDMRVFDIEAGRAIFSNRFGAIRMFGGVRYAEIEQGLRMEYDGRDFVNGVVSTEMEVDGFGFQVGTEGQWLMANGFGLFGRFSTGIIHGRFETSLYESNIDGVQLITDARDSFDKAIPSLEVSGGTSWQYGGFEIAVGYEFSNWFKLNNRAAFVDDIHEGIYGPFENDILLEGLFIRSSFVR